jgi:hypothetical protein
LVAPYAIPETYRPLLAIECKWSPDEFDTSGILAFRRQYPEGENFVVAHDVNRSYRRKHAGVDVR